MSKPGYNQEGLRGIFRDVTGQSHIQVARHMEAGRLVMDFKAATVMTDSNGAYLEAKFVGPDGKPITLGVQDVQRLQEWTNAATIEARANYVAEQREYAAAYKAYGELRQEFYADGKLSQNEYRILNREREELIVSRQEALEAHKDWQAYARQNNEVIEAQNKMREVGHNHNANVDVANALKPGGFLHG